MMLDRQSIKFLHYLREQPDNTVSCSDGAPIPEGYGEQNEYFAMMDYLESGGYVSVRRDKLNNHKSVKLAHKGFHLKEFRRREFLNYIAEKWVDFIAMLMAVGSLVVSIVALMSRQ